MLDLYVTAEATRSYVIGVTAMYVDDARFAATYDKYGEGTAVLVRDSMKVCAERHLTD